MAQVQRMLMAFCFVLPFLTGTAAAQTDAEEAPAKEPIVVSTKVFKPFAFKQADGAWTGFSVELWQALAEQLNLETTWHSTDSVGALLDAVHDGPAEIGIAAITITSQREEHVDFSFPFFESGLQILVSDNGKSGFGTLLALLPNMLRIVGVGVCILWIMAHFIWFAEHRKNPEDFPDSYLRGIWDSFWWAAVTVTTVGYGDRIPKSVIGRIFALIWMFSGLLLVSFFTASVTTALTVQSLEGDISGPKDLPGKKVGTLQGGTAATWLYSSGAKVHEYESLELSIAALTSGELEAVVYDSPALLYYASHEGRGVVHTVGAVFEKQSYGIALKEQSAYHEPINYALLKLRENGAYHDIYAKWFGE